MWWDLHHLTTPSDKIWGHLLGRFKFINLVDVVLNKDCQRIVRQFVHLKMWSWLIGHEEAAEHAKNTAIEYYYIILQALTQDFHFGWAKVSVFRCILYVHAHRKCVVTHISLEGVLKSDLTCCFCSYVLRNTVWTGPWSVRLRLNGQCAVDFWEHFNLKPLKQYQLEQSLMAQNPKQQLKGTKTVRRAKDNISLWVP